MVDVDGPQPPARVAYILSGVAGALAEAHGVGLIHRDIKPANIMLVQQGGKPDVAKVLDFGLVKELERTDTRELTQADSITGTPQYLAPEAIRSPDDPDERVDLYALGAVGYFLLTGEHVFTGETVIDICAQHLQAAPQAPSERLGALVPQDLEALILRCLSKDPADRPQSALELQEALHACDGLGSWIEADARAWWERHRAALKACRETHPHPGSEAMLAIDLEDRADLDGGAPTDS